MRLFLHGTLLNPETLATRSGDPALPRRCRPAVLFGWRRVSLGGVQWPTLRRCTRDRTEGKIVDVGASALRRLTAWEGRDYQLRHVVMEPRIPAWTWIAPGGTNHPWP